MRVIRVVRVMRVIKGIRKIRTIPVMSAARVLTFLFTVFLIACGSDSESQMEQGVDIENMRSSGVNIGLQKGYYQLNEVNTEGEMLTHIRLSEPSMEGYSIVVTNIENGKVEGTERVLRVWLKAADNKYYLSNGFVGVNLPYVDCNGFVEDTNILADIYLFGLCNSSHEIIALNEYGFSYIKEEREASTLTVDCSTVEVTSSNNDNSGNIADIIYDPYTEIFEEYKKEAKALCDKTSGDSIEIEVEERILFQDYLWEFDAEFTTKMDNLQQEVRAK